MKKISCAGSDSGTVLLETVLVMPILLSFFIGTWQMALLWQARQVVAYAAYAAARAGMVETAGTAAAAAEAAAEQVCTLVGMPSFNYLADGALVEYDFATSTLSTASLVTPDAPGVDREFPWLGTIMGSRDVASQVTVVYSETPNETCSATVTLSYPLIYSRLPVYFCYFIIFPTLDTSADPWTLVGAASRPPGDPAIPYPSGTIDIKETAVLSKPFTVMN
jgi:Flp pilus assembly protein TadG